MRVDVHQHVWTAPLVAALGRRSTLPLICGGSTNPDGTAGLSTVHCAGEQPWGLDTSGESAPNRTALLTRDGVDAAIVAISSPVGIEALPRAEALELIDAQLTGVEALGPRFGAWGPLISDAPEADDVDALAARGCLGVSIASGAIATPARLAALAPVLARVAALDLPLFVHPGRAHGDPVSHAGLEEPLWWPALTDYVASMQAAWLSWVSAGRGEHPGLTVIFGMLAGLAPLQAERLASRGGPPLALDDPLTFYDTSSYGPDAIKAFASLVPTLQLLYGSDRPVLEPGRHLLTQTLQTNAGRLFAAAFRDRGVQTIPTAAPPLAA